LLEFSDCIINEKIVSEEMRTGVQNDEICKKTYERGMDIQEDNEVLPSRK
jgi:hypothetical protein